MKTIIQILITFLAIAFVTLVPHSGIIPLPFTYIIPVLLFIWFYLKFRQENFTDIDFSFKHFQIKSVFIGTLSAALLIVFINLAFFPLLRMIIDLPPANLGDFTDIKGNTGFYIFLLAMSWIVGGFYEEVVFHGFIFTRLEKLISSKYAVLLSFLLSNIIFALYHLQLGAEGVINAFIVGSVCNALMLHYKRNMWYAIFCHAAFDTIALTYMYAEHS
jgi:membrane protease YdiL (CAAX protease family)